ncbi:MAG: KilA-N domain-containing protein [Muribaculaceae bacterium]|nr:KilA-N domain-containing protein [Muribaculaceae bacterium]
MKDDKKTAGKTATIQYSYNGQAISFAQGNNVMINATQMAKPFEKNPKDFLKTQQTKEFLTELSVVRNLTTDNLVKVVQGGNTQGTWMHEDVAIEFARWLSPCFAIWCNDRIKELMRNGVTRLTTEEDEDLTIAEATVILMRRLETMHTRLFLKEEQLESANETIRLQQEHIQQLTPKAEYFSNVLKSDTTYTFTQVAYDLGFRSVHALMRELQSRNIVYKQSGQWLPMAEYRDTFFKTRTTRYVRKDETIGTNLYTVVTEAGRSMLHSMFDEKGGNNE